MRTIGMSLLAAAIAASMGGGGAIAIGPCPRCNATLGDNAARCDTCLRATGREPSLFGYEGGIAIGDGTSTEYSIESASRSASTETRKLADAAKTLGGHVQHATSAAINLTEALRTDEDRARLLAASNKRARKALKLPKD